MISLGWELPNFSSRQEVHHHLVALSTGGISQLNREWVLHFLDQLFLNTGSPSSKSPPYAAASIKENSIVREYLTAPKNTRGGGYRLPQYSTMLRCFQRHSKVTVPTEYSVFQQDQSNLCQKYSYHCTFQFDYEEQ